MAVAEIRGARVNYEVLDGGEQSVALTPGRRRSLDGVRVLTAGENLHSLLGDGELHDVRSDVSTIAPGDLGPAELAELQVRRREEIGEIFVDFLQRTVVRAAAAR